MSKGRHRFLPRPPATSGDRLGRLLAQAQDAHRRGQLAQAKSGYKEVLKFQPRNAEVLQLLGIVAGQIGDFRQAVELMDRAIAVDASVADYHANRGIALRSLGQCEAAVESFDVAIGLDSSRAADHFNRAVALQELGQIESAIEGYDRAISLHPGFAEAFANRGIALEELGRLDDALASYDHAIALVPDYAEAHSSRGVVLRKMGQLEASLASFEVAIVLRPDYAEAHSNRGNALQAQNRLDEAVASYDRAIALRPDYAEAHSNRGVALEELGRLDEAIASLDRAIALQPDDAEAHSNRGSVLEAQRRFDEAVASYDRAIALRPDYAEAYSNRGIALRQLGRLEDAMASYDAALASNPSYAEAYSNRGNALVALGRPDSAVESFDRAIALRPDYAEAYSNRGIALFALHQPELALASYESAIALKPGYAEALSNRGIAFQDVGRLEDAVESYDQAIALKPDYAEAYANRGVALSDLKQHEAAIESYAKALAIRPDYDFAPGALLHLKMQICDWTDFDSQARLLQRQLESARRASPSFPVLSIFDSPRLHRLSAEMWAADKCPPNASLGPIVRADCGTKIRIGYFSADFGEHPVSYLMAGVFEGHDRSRFEIIGFSFGVGEPDAMTARIAAAMDDFVDVRRQSDVDVARLARERKIDLAIDLGGFTHSSRPGIFAARAAPVQASYLGYLGTMGAPWMDYLLADEVIVPPESRGHYEEKIAYLASFQANDRERAISERPMTREEFGLPAAGFVFCSFNAAYKIAPSTFASWMRILKRVEGSVLFLLADNERAVSNLRHEAARCGVAPERLVFAARLARTDYIARYRVADLFLDTLPYNAGTTASDALWAGLPVLTLRGKSFPARVAASLLIAIGLPELITTSAADYERVAAELASDPSRFNALKQALLANRLTTPLFDTALFTRDLESVYQAMLARSAAGLPPDHILRERTATQ